MLVRYKPPIKTKPDRGLKHHLGVASLAFSLAVKSNYSPVGLTARFLALTTNLELEISTQ